MPSIVLWSAVWSCSFGEGNNIGLTLNNIPYYSKEQSLRYNGNRVTADDVKKTHQAMSIFC